MEITEKICKFCGMILPDHKHRLAKYCNDYCCYEARKNRSKSRYAQLSNIYAQRRKNEKILEQFYPFIAKKVIVTAEMLDALAFDFGFSDGELSDKNGNIWKKNGAYFYLLNNNKTITIWKPENSSQ